MLENEARYSALLSPSEPVMSSSRTPSILTSAVDGFARCVQRGETGQRRPLLISGGGWSLSRLEDWSLFDVWSTASHPAWLIALHFWTYEKKETQNTTLPKNMFSEAPTHLRLTVVFFSVSRSHKNNTMWYFVFSGWSHYVHCTRDFTDYLGSWKFILKKFFNEIFKNVFILRQHAAFPAPPWRAHHRTGKSANY